MTMTVEDLCLFLARSLIFEELRDIYEKNAIGPSSGKIPKPLKYWGFEVPKSLVIIMS
jgi:hypothetical protein